MKSFAMAAIAASAVALSGCASLITGGDLVRPGEPTGTLRIINVGSGVINAVLISDCNASTYGLNRLPSGVSISPGRAYDFTVSAGCWDTDVGRVGYGEVKQRLTVHAGMTFSYSVGDGG